jgi:hypothetical protein
MGDEKELPQALDNYLFPKIFQTFRMAIQPSKLIIAFSAVTIVCLAGWIMDFSKTVVTASGTQTTELQIYMTNPDQVQSYIEQYKQQGERRGVFSTLWRFGSARFHSALTALFAFNIPDVAANIADCFKALVWAFRYHYIYSTIFFIIALAVISIAGGGLCRISALQFARGEKPGLTEALGFSTKKFISFFTAPLAPLGIIIFIGLFIFLLGLIGNIPRIGELIMGICIPLVLVASALIGVVLIGTVAGFNLMFPAVAYDGSDSFDAISRSFSYIYAKPWRMGFYTAVAVVYGAICYMFVRFFAFLLLWVSHRCLQLGVLANNRKLTAIWPQQPSFMDLFNSSELAAANWSESLAAFLIYLFVLAVIGLVVSFIISFYFSANTVIYALMRNRVDNTALEDVYTFEELKAEPAVAESEPEEKQPRPEPETQPNSSSSSPS